MDENDLSTPDNQVDYVNGAPDLTPVELPGRNIIPNTDDRLAAIESILNISY